eukprot:3687350-Alexandrium_andersonii.AAC.1
MGHARRAAGGRGVPARGCRGAARPLVAAQVLHAAGPAFGRPRSHLGRGQARHQGSLSASDARMERAALRRGGHG